MKKALLFLFLFASLCRNAPAQTGNDTARSELHDLLDERKKMFDSYSLSLEKHSGIFGNKTKNDIKTSNKVLIDIVKTDNRIISALYRVVDFRTYEKVNTNYDIQKNDELLKNLRHATDTLSKQVDVLKSANHSLQSRLTGTKWMVYILAILSIWLLFNRWRNKQRLSAGE